LPWHKRSCLWIKKKFEAWLKTHQAGAIDWRFLRPTQAKATRSWLEIEQDDSIFVQGDASKHDTYELEFANLPAGITALRLEALPDERLPKNGPGRAYYEGPKGDFFLSEIKLSANSQPVKLQNGSHNYAKQWIGKGDPGAMAALDGDLQTGWSVSGRGRQAESGRVATHEAAHGQDFENQNGF